MKQAGNFPSSNSKRTLRVAVLGLGAVGSKVAQALLRGDIPNATLVAASAHRNKLWLKGTGVDCSTDPTLLASRSGIDVIISCLGGMTTEYTAIGNALNSAKHVLTPNATLAAVHGEMLSKIAQVQNVQFGYLAGVVGPMQLPASQYVQSISLQGGSGFEDFLQQLEAQHVRAIPSVSAKMGAYQLTLLRAALFGTWGTSNLFAGAGAPIHTLTPTDAQLAVRLGLHFAVQGVADKTNMSYGLTLTETKPQQNTLNQRTLILKTNMAEWAFTLPQITADLAAMGLLQQLSQICHKQAVNPLASTGQPQANSQLTAYFIRTPHTRSSKIKGDPRWNIEHIAELNGHFAAIVQTGQPLTVLQNALGAEALIVPVDANTQITKQTSEETGNVIQAFA